MKDLVPITIPLARFEARLQEIAKTAPDPVYKCADCKDVRRVTVHTATGPRSKACESCGNKTEAPTEKTYFRKRV
jgi:DNA-directed RNA polymerase subunit RPC12/RpoP